jgi:hypothetical protein
VAVLAPTTHHGGTCHACTRTHPQVKVLQRLLGSTPGAAASGAAPSGDGGGSGSSGGDGGGSGGGSAGREGEVAGPSGRGRWGSMPVAGPEEVAVITPYAGQVGHKFRVLCVYCPASNVSYLPETTGRGPEKVAVITP